MLSKSEEDVVAYQSIRPLENFQLKIKLIENTNLATCGNGTCGQEASQRASISIAKRGCTHGYKL